MTVFNTINKIGRRFVVELENLVIGLFEKSNINQNTTIEAKLVDKGRWNTVNKLKRRKVNDLQGLKMDIIQFSFREKDSNISMLNESRDTTNFNNFDKVGRRKYNELDGLFINIIEKSKITITTKLNNIKLIKPLKTYKNKIKLLFKYKNNMKY